DINKLFTFPLIGSAALLSFAHGANDVANAVGPLAAIVGMIGEHAAVTSKVGIPIWVMVIGASGIALGLLLFGTKIINTVGESITKLDQMRAFCVALSAAVTVIVATGFGLPVSSTHIAVGSIFGIGLFREFKDMQDRKKRRKAKQKKYEHKVIKRRLVRRKHLLSILTAWIITVPCSCLIAGTIYLILSKAFIG
ncbi:MAG: inorganic phosphate transporter, partial [Rickettsiales bacterium]